MRQLIPKGSWFKSGGGDIFYSPLYSGDDRKIYKSSNISLFDMKEYRPNRMYTSARAGIENALKVGLSALTLAYATSCQEIPPEEKGVLYIGDIPIREIMANMDLGRVVDTTKVAAADTVARLYVNSPPRFNDPAMWVTIWLEFPKSGIVLRAYDSPPSRGPLDVESVFADTTADFAVLDQRVQGTDRVKLGPFSNPNLPEGWETQREYQGRKTNVPYREQRTEDQDLLDAANQLLRYGVRKAENETSWKFPAAPKKVQRFRTSGHRNGIKFV